MSQTVQAGVKSTDQAQAMNPVYRRRLMQHRMGMLFSFLAMGLGLFVLAWILLTLVFKGVAALNLGLLTENTPGPGDAGGGLLNL